MSDFSIEVLVKNLFINGSAIKEIAKLLNAHKSAISEMIEVTGFTR